MSALELSSTDASPVPQNTVRPLPAYTVDAVHEGETFLIRARGELAVDGSRDLRVGLERAEGSSAPRILLDVDQVRTLDATGLRTILEASRRSARNGNRLWITRGRGHVADLFRLTALDHTLQFADVSSGDLES